jgi:hypothetical protein
MDTQEHSTVREGLIVGLLGAAIVAAWYFAFDAAAGRPFHTPNALGKVVFRGDVGPGEREILPGIVAGYTALHLVMFALGGMAMTFLVHLATRNLGLRMGIWIGLVVGFCLFTGLMYMLFTASGERTPLWSVVGGTLSAIAAMGWYLWRRHPGLAADAQLGDESTPHAPGAPRG